MYAVVKLISSNNYQSTKYVKEYILDNEIGERQKTKVESIWCLVELFYNFNGTFYLLKFWTVTYLRERVVRSKKKLAHLVLLLRGKILDVHSILKNSDHKRTHNEEEYDGS